MPAPLIARTTFDEGNRRIWTLAQLVGAHGLLLVLADVDSIEVNVWDSEDHTLIHGPIAIMPGGVIFDALAHAGTLWTEDDIGANFAHKLDLSAVFATTEAEGGRTYRIEYEITTTSANGSGDIAVVNLATCRAMFGN